MISTEGSVPERLETFDPDIAAKMVPPRIAKRGKPSRAEVDEANDAVLAFHRVEPKR